MGRDFPPVQSYPASCKMGTGSFPEVKSGRGVLLITHPFLVPWSWKSRVTQTLGHNRVFNGINFPLHYVWKMESNITYKCNYLFVLNSCCPYAVQIWRRLHAQNKKWSAPLLLVCSCHYVCVDQLHIQSKLMNSVLKRCKI